MRDRRQRDREFAEFVTATQQRLFRQAYLLSGAREPAEDLVQSTLLKVYAAWARINDPGAYAWRTLIHTFLAAQRRSSRERELHSLVHATEVEGQDGQRDGRITVIAALGELPPRMRAVVLLRHWEDRSVHETAELLDCSVGTVKSASARGLAQLRERLGDTFDERTTAGETHS